MFTFINILKNFENKISQSEMIESQYTERENYQNENFHLITFSRVIINKIKDSSNLINILNSSINEINEEILNQINSNFNNHLILISKIQTVDYLIENIERPLHIIKSKIKNKLNVLDKNENEIKSIIHYLKKNEKSLRYSKIYFSYYKLYSQAKILEKSICEIEGSTIFKKILENNENTTILAALDLIKTYLIQIFRLLTLNNKMERMINALKENSNNLDFDNYNEKGNESKDKSFFFEPVDNIDNNLSLNKIIETLKMNRAEEEIRFSFIEKFLEKCLNELIAKFSSNEKENVYLFKTLLKLIYDCYRISPKLKTLYEKIKEFYFKKDIEEIICKESTRLDLLDGNSNITRMKRLSYLEDILKNKYSFLYDIFKESKFKINLICIWSPLIDVLHTDKNISICIEPQIFSNTLNSLLDLMSKFPFCDMNNKIYKCLENDDKAIHLNEDNNSEESIRKKIISFFQTFSYFTYFQFIQNDLTKLIINSPFIESKDKLANHNENISEDLIILDRVNRKMNSLTNFLFNFNSYNENIFKEKRLFLKNISNYMNFIYTILNFISNRILIYFSNDNHEFNRLFSDDSIQKIFKKEKNLENNSKIVSQLKGNIKELVKNLYKYFTFISDLLKFICEIVERESFVFFKTEDIEKLKTNVKKLYQASNLYEIINDIIGKIYFDKLLKLDPDINKSMFNIFIKID